MNGSDFLFFCLDVVCAITLLFAAWTNLVRKRISRFGPDALLFFLYSMIRREKVLKYSLRENPSFIQRMGTLTLILGFAFLNAAMENLKVIWPYLQAILKW